MRDPAELEDTFRKALAAGTTALIDVKADKDCADAGLRFQRRRAGLVLSRIGGRAMTVLDMNPGDAAGRCARRSTRRWRRGARRGARHFGGPYVALLNHPELARRVEELGFFLKFEGTLPRTVYQFIVLTIARATGADYEWHDHIAHARAAGLPADVIDCIGSGAHRDAAASPTRWCTRSWRRRWRGRWCPTICRRSAAAQWGKHGLVEIVVLSGFYQMFAAINQGFDIRPPAKSG